LPKIDASIGQPRIDVGANPAKELRVNQRFERGRTRGFIEPKQSLCLPARQPEPGHFCELAADAPEQAFGHGRSSR
jgi:hypothetical protein